MSETSSLGLSACTVIPPVRGFALGDWEATERAMQAGVRLEFAQPWLAQPEADFQPAQVWMGVQGFINMGVNMGLLPTKGLTLPLLSYGGSGILANCIAMAVLLRIDFENRRLQKGLQT